MGFNFYSKKIALLCCGIWISLVSQTSAQILQQSVLSSGGATISGASYVLQGTMGQPAVGKISEGTLHHSAGFWYVVRNTITGIETPSNLLPTTFQLYQNFPNPFNPVTTIRFAIPKFVHVRIQVFDLMGREAMRLVDKELAPGYYDVQVRAENLGSGIYFYRMQANQFIQTRKFIVLK